MRHTTIRKRSLYTVAAEARASTKTRAMRASPHQSLKGVPARIRAAWLEILEASADMFISSCATCRTAQRERLQEGGSLPASKKVARSAREGAGDWLPGLSHVPSREDPVETVVENSFLAQSSHCSFLSFRRHCKQSAMAWAFAFKFCTRLILVVC